MSRHDDGVEIDFPVFRFYAGSRGVHIGPSDDDGVIDMDMDDVAEYRDVRRIVRRRLRFVRHLFVYLALNGFFVLIDWQTGGPGNGISWSIWV
ncbi:MAG: 2TM domain-containing protein, partial [Chloroflexi bacterium]|nr:2TM domain-containing protein [Chloroflexota bacterium]